jgi:anti-sigma factor RsiW
MMGGSGDCGHIDCAEAARRLWAYLDGELPAAAARDVEVHLEQCPPCLQLSAAQRTFLGLVGDDSSASDEVQALLRQVRRKLAAERGG